MIKKQRETKERGVTPLVQVHVVRPGRVVEFGAWCLALESLRPFISYAEAIRIFEKTFHL